MSRQNKVNPDHYTQSGRLSPDDLARERQKQGNSGLRSAHKNRPLPPWMLGQPGPAAESHVEEPEADAGRREISTVDADADERTPAARPRLRTPRKAKRQPAAKRAGASRKAASRTTSKPRAKTASRSTRAAKATPARTAAKSRTTRRTTHAATTRTSVKRTTTARAGKPRARKAKKR